MRPLLLILLLPAFGCAPDFSGDDSSAEDGSDGADGTDGSDGSDGSDGTGGGDWPMVYVNELMSSNASTIADESGAFPDWVELYNPGSEAVELGGWTISDDLAEADKHALDGSLSVPAGGYLLLWADDDEDDGANHLNFKLAAEGEQLGLFAPDGTAIDQVEFGEIGTDISVARQPDGSDNWQITDAPTPEASNGDR